MKEQYSCICEALVDKLVDAQASKGYVRAPVCLSSMILKHLQNVLTCIKTVQLLAMAQPSIISSTKASTLLPYLKNSTTVGLKEFACLKTYINSS